MISREDYIQLRAFARQDGLLMGAIWIITFGCFVGSIKLPALQIGFVTGLIATPFIVFYRLKNFRDNVLDGSISYKRAVAFCAMAQAYASLIIAAATMAYFYFLDDGMMMSTLHNNIAIPEIRESFRQAGMNPDDLEKQITEIGQARPIDFAFSVFINGIVSSFFLSLIIGMVGMKKKRQ